MRFIIRLAFFHKAELGIFYLSQKLFSVIHVYESLVQTLSPKLNNDFVSIVDENSV
jgi:hypothetical protein